ncbi:MAG: chemotaxis protein CheW, partial [Desulfuromonas sp.]
VGMGKQEEAFIILLDIDKIFSGEELSLVQAAGE